MFKVKIRDGGINNSDKSIDSLSNRNFVCKETVIKNYIVQNRTRRIINDIPCINVNNEDDDDEDNEDDEDDENDENDKDDKDDDEDDIINDIIDNIYCDVSNNKKCNDYINDIVDIGDYIDDDINNIDNWFDSIDEIKFYNS